MTCENPPPPHPRIVPPTIITLSPVSASAARVLMFASFQSGASTQSRSCASTNAIPVLSPAPRMITRACSAAVEISSTKGAVQRPPSGRDRCQSGAVWSSDGKSIGHRSWRWSPRWNHATVHEVSGFRERARRALHGGEGPDARRTTQLRASVRVTIDPAMSTVSPVPTFARVDISFQAAARDH